MSFKKTGDWDKAVKILGGSMPYQLARELKRATEKNALLLVREIQRGIRKQAPGGKPFAPLAESTIHQKGSSKALIDTGFLVSSITQKIVGDSAFVGLLRGTVNKKGENLVNIGAVMEYGATINHPNGATITIPPRPFLHPTMEKHKDAVVQNYVEAISKVFP